MAEKISIEIGLDGGDEVNRQLEGILKTGEKTFSGLQEAAEQLDFAAIADGFQSVGDTGVQAFDKIQSAVKSTVAFEQIIQGVKKIEGAFDTLGTAAVRLGTRMTKALGPLGVVARAFGPIGIASGIAAGAVVKFGDDAADALNKLTGNSAKLDLTIQNFDKLQKTLLQAGVGSDTILPGLQQLQEALSKDFFKVDVITGFQNLIAQLERMPDGAERTKLAMDKLGEGLGTQVIAGLQTGTINANNFAATLAKITPATQEQIAQAAQYQQSLNQLSNSWTEFKNNVGTPVGIPLFDLMKTGLDQIKQGIATTKREWQALQALLTSITPSVGIDISLTGSLQSQLDAAKVRLDELGKAAAQAGQASAQGAQTSLQAWTSNEAIAARMGQTYAQAGQAAAQAGQQSAQAGQEAAQAGQQSAQAGQAAAQAGQQSAQAGQEAQTAWQMIKDPIIAATTALGEFVSKLAGIAWDALKTAGVTAWQAIIDKVKELIGLKPSSAPGAPGGAPGMARGGLLGGRGTGTSDSNLAWLSRGEYIMPARAVRQPGVLSFLEALRRSGGIPGYAEGGSVGGGQGFQKIKGALQSFIQAFDAIDVANKANLTTMFNLSRSILAAGTTMDQSMLAIQKTMGIPIRSLEELLRTPGRRGGGLLGGRGTGTSDSNLAWVSRGEYIMPARAVRQPGVLSFLEALRRSGHIPGFADGGSVSDIPARGWTYPKILEAELEDLEAAIATFNNELTDSFGRIIKTQDEINRFKEWVRLKKVYTKELQEDIKFFGLARGGLLGGRGTGTSDSNLAWVSRGEHVMPARAVRQPGVLSFLEALRRSGGNLSRVLDGMGRFALGGMVPQAIPAFAAGGLNSGNHVTIQFPGLPAIGGLRASSGVVGELQKAAALAQVRSGGRKPSRYS